MGTKKRDITTTVCRLAAFAAVVFISAGLMAGCSSTTGPEDGQEMAERTTTQGVIDLLADSYNSRDATSFAACLAADFEFYLEPSTVGSDPTLPDYWGKAEEVGLHEIAFGTRLPVTSLSLSLEEERAPLEIPGPAPTDPSEWEFYQRYRIEMVDEGITYEVNGYATFTLAAAPGDTNTQGDQLWSIVEWTDTGDVPCRSDATNWTEIKLLFAEDPDGYLLRTTPANAIEKFRQAYAAMDALAVLDCFSDTFSFWLNPGDLNDPQNPLPESWDLGDESTITWNMFGPGTNIDHITLTLTQIGDPTEIPPANPGDPSGWEYVCAYDLYAYLPGQWTFWANAASRFTVSVDPDETGPAGETLWEISKWEDIYLGGRDGVTRYAQYERVEETTWGGIKALYR